MADFINIIQNNGLDKIARGASNAVINAIGGAAIKTGVDFAYLLQQAKAESSFITDAKASTSSASGLFQFINSTWLNMVDQYGEKFGLDTNGKSQSEILDLRNDPQAASSMAAQLAADNQSYLQKNWGGDVGATELYFAHFLGPRNAASFLNARDENGAKSAADLFPAAAKANKNVFFNKDGTSKTLNEVYAFFDKKFEEPTSNAQDITTENAALIAQNALENMEISPLQLSDGKPDTRPNYNQLFQKTGMYNYASPLPNYQLIQQPVELMILGQLDLPDVFSTRDSNKS